MTMFTGIIQQTAKVAQVVENDCGIRLSIKSKGWEQPVQIGESISIDGCCLTVTTNTVIENGICLEFDVIPETLQMTTMSDISKGQMLNIERALRADSFLGGHIVQGHIDGIATVLSIDEGQQGECRLRIDTSSLDQSALILKGSIAINGVSLTIATLGKNWLEVALIPTTLDTTTFRLFKVGDSVNIETDMLARTTAKMVQAIKQQSE